MQNYIAPPGNPMEDATFVPPAPLMILDALSNWESYLHATEKDPLVQLAVLKGQFELIHPFRDGNGRIGRMLIPLILFQKKLLSHPIFYISAYLERNRNTYYDRLQAISADGDWNGWISFFLDAITKQAEENSQKASSILNLYDSMKRDVPGITRSQYAIQAIDALFSRPILSSTDFIRDSGIPKQSAHRILKQLNEEGLLEILHEAKGRRATVYAFQQLIGIAEG